MNDIKFNRYIFTIKYLGLEGTVKIILNLIFSINHYYILHKKLDTVLHQERIRENITIGLITDEDIQTIINSLNTLDVDSKREIVTRLFFYESGFKNCYVGKTGNGDIACFQWLIYPTENHIINKHYSRIFAPLGETQVMLENAFTYPKFRGRGLLPRLMNELEVTAREAGYRFAVTYIRKDRLVPLNEAIKMGFKITKLVPELKMLGITKRFL